MGSEAGRYPRERKAFEHVKERLWERYRIVLDWDGFDAMNHQATTAALRVNHQARIPGTELRFFYYLGHPFLVFFNLTDNRIGSVLPYSDIRWRYVPVEHRPPECFQTVPVVTPEEGRRT